MRRLRALVMAAAAAATVSATPGSFARIPVDTGRSHSSGSSGDAGDEASPSPSPGFTLAPDLCEGLPRNAILASCPAPCLLDAACIVYDQDPAHSQLTGCDYATASSNSFCSMAEQQARSCELHCFARSPEEGVFGFAVHFEASERREPQPRSPEDASLLSTPSEEYPFQANEFVRAVGHLDVTGAIHEIFIAGAFDRSDLGRYVDVAVSPVMIATASAVTTVRLVNLPLGSDAVTGFLQSAPPSLTTLVLARTQLTKLPSEMFSTVQQLETLSLTGNTLSFMSPTSLSLPSLKELVLDSNQIDFFQADTPSLETLDLANNKLLCIPASVFTYRSLQSLNLSKNRLIKPLVLTAEQLEFLNALPSLKLELIDPPSLNFTTSLPPNSRGNPLDSIDISQYLLGATATTLRGNPDLPVQVVDSASAAQYNTILESRASAFDGSKIPTTSSPPQNLIPADACNGVPRNTLLANCASACPLNGACVAYDQDAELSMLSGCDYDVSSPKSFCTNITSAARTCEFQCFAAFKDASQFKFIVPFKAPLGEKTPRKAGATAVLGSSKVDFTTDEISFLSNTFLAAVGQLNLQSPVADVWISGGRTELGKRGVVADMTVSPSLLSQTPSVTSLSLLNIDLRTSNVIAILRSAPSTLKSLTLRNTLLTEASKEMFSPTQQLVTLTLAQNDLTAFSAALPELRALDLRENALTSIDIVAPNLKTLDLSENSFVQVPTAVFKLPNLQSLNLMGNPIVMPLVVSQPQLDLLLAINNLQLPQNSIPTTAPTTSPTTNASASVVDTDGTVLVVDGIAATVGGIRVIVVSESSAQQYNDLLQKIQQSAQPSGTPRSTDVVASSSVSAAVSNDTSVASTGPTSFPAIANTANSSSTSPATHKPSNMTGVNDVTGTKKASDISLTSVYVLVSVGSALVLALAILFAVYKRKEKAAKRLSSETYEALGDGVVDTPTTGSSSNQVVSWWADDDMLSHRLGSSDISDVCVVGGGSICLLWLVEYRNSQQLVAKRLIQREGQANEINALALFGEAKMASQLEHPSVVKFVGVAWTDKTDFQVLYEYMTNGNLSSYLAQIDGATLPWLPNKLQLAVDIIEALVYTHSFHPPLLHRDLKASNVLLDEDVKAKLSDFGYARLESENDTMTTTGVGSGRWLAPEILLGSTSYGIPSDIYSFGVLLCELDTHREPYAGESDELSESVVLQRVARGELRPSVSASCPPEIREIAEACLASDASIRPNAMQVAYSLRLLLP